MFAGVALRLRACVRRPVGLKALYKNPVYLEQVNLKPFNRGRWINNGKTTHKQSIEGCKPTEKGIDSCSDSLHKKSILMQKNRQLLTKEKLLSEATGLFERFKINTKWLLIRGNRPFSGEELSTLFSWFIISHLVWIVLGTTTFVSLLLFTMNTVFAKGLVGKFVGNCLNRCIEGVDVEFQDAMVPEWGKGNISFKKVRVKTTPGAQGSYGILSFDLSFNQINLTLSVKKWLQGEGLIQDIYLSGVKGAVSVRGGMKDGYRIADWFSNHNYRLGEVEINDSLITFNDVDFQQQFHLSVYNLHMKQLRLQWCLLDLLNAEVVSGAINESLFSIHKRQHKLAYMREFEKDFLPWSRIARVRLNPISIKELGLNKSKAFNWMEAGQVEILADIMLPTVESNELYEEENKYIVMDLKFVFTDLAARMGSETPKLSDNRELVSIEELKPIINFINYKRGVFCSLKDVDRVNVPWNTKVSINKQKSYPDKVVISSGAFKWPDGEDTIAMNREVIKYHEQPTSKGNEIVLKCRVVKDSHELQDVFLFKETGVYDQLAMEIYADLMKMIEESEYKKKNDWVKVWGTTVASQLLIFGLGAIV
ncbi:HFL159Cp [Eremothecium sinecaudum]|uniref:Mitochondrial distribution and morphology protein 32 n=1 Tax=Eremothecium sinecaudum TaxID=45286 RepID=A0A0X8HUC8_9SACH|nr:HFL159Cp [Eremothecium sinecaudum]AMD21697.1 HFL159Cp [Eremothecium sinecaudum]